MTTMARPLRTISALLFSAILSIGFAPVAQTQPAQAPTVTNAPTDNNADQVAPGREDLEPAEPGFDDNTVDNQTGANWHPTVNPKDEITPGQMRSDKEEIPGGFTKEQANQAEIQEAKEQASQTRSGIQTLAAVNTCRTYWPSPYRVCGKIREKYDSLGGPQSFLTWPKSDELTVPDGVGRRNEFVNGFIYWHPNTGAHPITTHFSVVWARTGWERGPLGYPTTDEFGLSDGIGRKQSFEHGHIYGSLAGLASIHGAIYDKWIQTGAEKGPLGYPVTDETKTPDGIGRFNRFTGGMIYWHPKHGAHAISGDILRQWSENQYETGSYGYPIADATSNGTGGVQQDFEFGQINSAPSLDGKSWSCVALVAKIILDIKSVGPVNYMCNSRGAWVQPPGKTATFRAATESNVQEPSVRSRSVTQAGEEVECDQMEPILVSTPLKDGASVRRNITTCIGRVDGEGRAEWSKEVSFTVKNTLTQRRHHSVLVQITSPTLPTGEFSLSYRVRQDKRFQRDDTVVPETPIDLQLTDVDPKVSEYSTPDHEGTYFVELMNNIIDIPSKNYYLNARDWSGGKTLGITTGRYMCPEYDANAPANACTWPEPVDTHL